MSYKSFILVFASFAAFGQAQTTVGTVSSTEPFSMRGVRMPVAGVPSWPMTAGDEIATDGAPATLTFRDGSRVQLAAHSKAKVERDGDSFLLRILAGAGEYNLSNSSNLRIFAQSRAITPTASQGRVTLSAVPEVSFTGGQKTTKAVAPPPVSRSR